MGACASLVKEESKYIILCDKSGNIVNVTNPLLYKLGYKFETLDGRFIGILMNKFMSMLHTKYFIDTFHNSQAIERNRLENKLKCLHARRPLIIYDIDGAARYVEIYVEFIGAKMLEGAFVNPILSTEDLFKIQFKFMEENEKLLYTEPPTNLSTEFKLNKSNAIIILIDFVTSTEMLNELGIPSAININKRFYDAAIQLIRNTYYPFIYIHERVGDSFVFALNTDWVYKTEMFCASLAVNFIFELIQNTRKYVKIRTGIGYGSIYYGLIGHTFSIFGFPMNMAARLEQKSGENEINICKEFYKKIEYELKILNKNIQEKSIVAKTALLKGFGETEYYCVPVELKSPFISYE